MEHAPIPVRGPRRILALWPEILVGLVLLACILDTWVWTRSEGWSSDSDIHKHMMNAVSCWHLLPRGPLAWWDAFTTGPTPNATFLTPLYPPLHYAVGALAFQLVGRASDATAIVSVQVFVVLLATATYLLGRQVASREAGAWGACAVITCGAIVQYSRSYYPDLPITSMVTMSWALLSASRGFGDGRFAFAAGVAIGLTFLAKFTAILYLLVPVAFVLAEGARRAASADTTAREGAGWVRRTVNLGLTATIAAAIALPWYWDRWSSILDAYHKNSVSEELRAGLKQTITLPVFGAADPDFRFYPHEIAVGMLHIPLTVGLVIGTLWALSRPTRRWRLVALAFSVVIPVAIYSVMTIKDLRFILPIIPGCVVIATAWIPATRWLRPLFLLPILAMGLVNVAGWHLDRRPLPITGLLVFHSAEKLPSTPPGPTRPITIPIKIPLYSPPGLDPLVDIIVAESHQGEVCRIEIDPPAITLELALYMRAPWLVLREYSRSHAQWLDLDLRTALYGRTPVVGAVPPSWVVTACGGGFETAPASCLPAPGFVARGRYTLPGGVERRLGSELLGTSVWLYSWEPNSSEPNSPEPMPDASGPTPTAPAAGSDHG